MTGPDTPLDLAAELERRDDEIAEALEQVQRLDAAVAEIRRRSDELRDGIESAPAQLAAIDRSHAEAAKAHEGTLGDLAGARERVAELEGGRRVNAAELERAHHEAEQARAREEDARHRVERLSAERAEQEATTTAARAEAAALLREAAEVAGEVATVDRLSETGREPAPGRLEGLDDWASRVHTALFVVRGQLEQGRERLVREANELGGAVLGEQLAGSSVTLVRRRIEEALRP